MRAAVSASRRGRLHFLERPAHQVLAGRAQGEECAAQLEPPDVQKQRARAQHDHGAQTFERVHGIDLAKLAQEFAHKSPDIAMREAMKEAALAVSKRTLNL